MVQQVQSVPGRAPLASRSGRAALQRRKFLIGGIVLVLAFGLLIYQGIANAGVYYLTVGEYLALDEEEATKQVRIGAKVQAGSVSYDAKTSTLRFSVVDDESGTASLPVVYRGVVPDSFEPGVEVVIEGNSATVGGQFEAKTLLTKCASKYEPA